MATSLVNGLFFFHNTVRELAETYNDFVISSLKAVCYGNTVLGYLAEDQLLDIITIHCCTDDWLIVDINEAVKQQISDSEKESETILTKPEVQLVVSDYILNSLLKKESFIENITDKQPACISAYNIPQKDCWYVMCATHKGITLLDSPKRLICVSKKNARIIYDEIVPGGG
jgi:predicted nucleic acid-binding protein